VAWNGVIERGSIVARAQEYAPGDHRPLSEKAGQGTSGEVQNLKPGLQGSNLAGKAAVEYCRCTFGHGEIERKPARHMPPHQVHPGTSHGAAIATAEDQEPQQIGADGAVRLGPSGRLPSPSTHGSPATQAATNCVSAAFSGSSPVTCSMPLPRPAFQWRNPGPARAAAQALPVGSRACSARVFA